MEKNTKVKFFNQIKNTVSKLKTNKILILGKGPSLDDFFSFKFKNYFIININDSYKFYEGDLIILNKPWALNDLSRLKKSSTILSSFKHDNISKKNFFYVKNFDQIKTNYFSKELSKNRPLFLIALDIIYKISTSNKKQFEVNLLGLDFNFKNIENYTSNYLQDFDSNSTSEKKYILKNQKKILLKIIKNKKLNSKLDIRHIGKLKESYCTNKKFIKKNIDIYKESQIKPKVKIVAEVTTNHFGDLKLLLKMAKLIKEAGADYIKIQKRDPNTFYNNKELSRFYYSKFGNTFSEYRKGLELTLDELKEFDRYCKKIKIKWFATVLDAESFKIINKFKPSLIKIPSTISTYKSFHDYISKHYSGPIVVSTGFTSKKYVDYILNKFKKNKKLYLLQCTSSYPTRDQDCNIGVISGYRDLSKKYQQIIPGFSSHDLGSSASIMSIAAGARMIEKHVFYETKPWAHFDKVALNLKNGEFKKFVDSIRNAEEIYGNEKKIKLKSEFHKYNKK